MTGSDVTKAEGENEGLEAIVRELEEQLASLLGLDTQIPIDRKKRLDAMGMDSILALDFLATLEPKHGLLPGTVLEDNPTVGQLAAYLHERAQRGA